MTVDPDHLTSAEKTGAIIALAEALHTATLVARPAPIVRHMRQWMDATPEVGDLVLEMSRRYRSADRQRVGTVVEVSDDPLGGQIVEVLLSDPPCGNATCADAKCIHRLRWSNALFIRIPTFEIQLALARLCMAEMAGGADR